MAVATIVVAMCISWWSREQVVDVEARQSYHYEGFIILDDYE